jgi:type III secretory pathway component EscV
MHDNLDRVLELGFGFMIFILALSVFFRMDGKTTNYMKVADDHLQFNRQMVKSTVETMNKEVSRGTLFFMLTDLDNKGKNQKMGDETYLIDNSGALDIVIDGTLFPIVTDYAGIQSLRVVMDNLESHTYTPEITVDHRGKIKSIAYTSY